MTLGSGAWHSEQNASPTEDMRFIQIWILPDAADLPPTVEQRMFTTGERTGRLLPVFVPARSGGAGGTDGAGPVSIHQDASVYVSRLEPGASVKHSIGPNRGAYAYVISGAATFDGQDVSTGDAAKVLAQDSLQIAARETTELIVVDVPLQFEPQGIWTGQA